MKLITQMKTKIESSVKNAIYRVTPIAKNEVNKMVSKGAANVRDTIFTVLGVGLLGYLTYESFSPSSIEEATDFAKALHRGINITYNEVHATYNFYNSKGVNTQ